MIKRLLLAAVLLSSSLVVSAQTPAYVAAYKIFGPNEDYADLMETDAAGNIYIAGRFGSGCDFDPSGGFSTLNTVGGNSDIFLAKYSPAGALLWKYPIGGTSEFLNSLKMDPQGNIWITGTAYSSITAFGLGGSQAFTPVGGGDGFALKYDSLGHPLYIISIGANNTESIKSIAFDPNGDFYIGGEFSSSSVDVDAGPNSFTLQNTTINGINSNAYVAKYDVNGNFLWAFGLNNGTTAAIKSLETDAAGRLVIGGNFTTSLTVDSANTVLTANAGSTDAFVARYSTAGVFDNAWSFGGTDIDNVYSMALDGNDFVILGAFSTDIDIQPGSGTTTFTSAGNRDIFLVKLDQNGSLMWGGTIKGNASDDPGTVKVGTNGDVYVSGSFNNSASFNLNSSGDVRTAVAGKDGFVAKYTSAGALITAMVIGSNGVDAVTGLTTAPNNEFLVCGNYTMGPLYVDPANPSTILGNTILIDAFFARYKDSLVSTGIAPVMLNEIQAYPNPAKDYIDLELIKKGNYTAQLMDVRGSILSDEITFTQSTRLDTHILESGLYFIAVKNENSVPVYYRFIKQ